MGPTTTALSKAFLEDHRHMTRGFWKLRKALESDDIAAAIEIAGSIDETVGPHIEFEEEVYYPALREILGREFVDRLYAEHGIGQGVLQEVLHLGEKQDIEPEVRDDLVDRTSQTLQHAVSCGTLLSHLDSLAPERQQEMLDKLAAIRKRGHLWSELKGALATRCDPYAGHN